MKPLRRRHAWQWALWLLSLAVAATLLVRDLRAEHARIGEEARERLQQQARLVDQVLVRQLGAIDAALQSVVIDLASWPRSAPPEGINRRLAALDAAVTGTRTLILTDVDGRVTAANRPELVGVNTSARDYFQQTRAANDAGQLHISAPFRTVLGVWSLNLTRAVQQADGRFAGVVTATLDPEWLRDVLAAANFAPDMWAAVAHAGGRLLLMTPNQGMAVDGVNLAVPGSMFSRHRESGQTETLFQGRTQVTGQPERVIAQRSLHVPGVGDAPALVLGLSRDLGAVHASWLAHAQRMALGLAALALGTGAALAWLQRSERAAARAAAAAQADLHAQEQRWLLALEASGLGVWDIDLRSGREVHSPRWHELLGLVGPEAVGGQSAWRKRLHPEDAAVATLRFNEHVAGRTPAYEAEYRLPTGPGIYRWLHARGRAVERDAQGQALRVVGTLLDITARHESTLLRIERDRAEASSRTMAEFVSRMSHELRTPLNAVLGFAQLLAAGRDRLTPQQHQTYVHRIEEGGWHLLELIDNVLDFSRVQRGEVALEPQPVALAAALKLAADAVAPQAQAAGLRLQVEPVPDGATVQADALRLQAVLSNLLGNALKYNKPRGDVRVSVSAGVGVWRIAISDTGIGIAAEQLAHLFEPFNRLGHASSAIEGSGLGLVLVRWYVEKMQGRIEVHSVRGEGSTFTVTLPAVAQA